MNLQTLLSQPLKILRTLIAILALVTILPSLVASETPPILNKQAQLDRFTFWDNRDWDWYKANIPFFESPDPEIDAVYYYRWEIITKHLLYVSPEVGYAFTEFINVLRPISCAMGLHMGEVRWLKNRRITDDFARYWYATPGADPRGYSNWYSSAIWGDYLVNGDKAFILSLLPSMEAQYAGWMKERWDPAKEMFHWSGMHDGMELNIGSRQTQKPFDGADSFRPTLNSYIYGDLIATADACDLAGDAPKAADYRAKAAALKEKVQQQLWDPKRQFFLDQFREDETSENGQYHVKAGTLMYQDGQFAGSAYGRQVSGYCPWMFDLPDKGKGYEIAWKGAVDPDVFLAPYGLYSAEKRDPLFLITKGGGCVWSGNNWPYADAETLMGMANVINNYPQSVLAKNDYFKVFKSYTHSQQKDGHPYIAEDSNPDTGVWINDAPNNSEDYFHSSYNDLLISGLVGLHPRGDDIVEVNPLVPDSWNYFALDDVAYHGHKLSILWDRDGKRYGRGQGLSIVADGKVIANGPTLGKLEGKLPVSTTPPPSIDRPVNFARSSGGGIFPRLTASTTAIGSSVGNLTDGVYYYTQPHPTNRWVSDASGSQEEWIDLDFGIERPVETLNLYLLDDGKGQTVRAPASVEIRAWDGKAWQPVSGLQCNETTPAGHRPMIFTLPGKSANRLRILMKPQPGASVGLTEIEAWGHSQLPLSEPPPPPGNLASQSKASASYTWMGDVPAKVIDGIIQMRGGDNRWTAFHTPNASDWIQLDFHAPVTISRATVCFYDDGGGVRVPKSYTVQTWNGSAWADVTQSKLEPSLPTAFTPNEITFRPVETSRFRVTFENDKSHDAASGTGITELMVFEK